MILLIIDALRAHCAALAEQVENFKGRWLTALKQLAAEKDKAQAQFTKDQNERLRLHEAKLSAEDRAEQAEQRAATHEAYYEKEHELRLEAEQQVERLTEYWGMPNAYTGGIAAWIEGEHDKDKRMSTFYREKWKAADQRATDWEIAWKYADQRAGRMEGLLRECHNEILDCLASGRPTGSMDTLADRIDAALDAAKGLGAGQRGKE